MTTFRLPSSHRLFQEASLEELLVWMHEQRFLESPIEARRRADGSVGFDDLDDPLLARWEEQIKAGQDPDLTEGLSDEARAALGRMTAEEREIAEADREFAKVEAASASVESSWTEAMKAARGDG